MKNDDLSLRYGRSKSNSKNDIVINPSILVNTISKTNLDRDEVMIGTVVHEAIHATNNYSLDSESLNKLFPDELDDVEDIDDVLEILTGPFGKYVFDILIHSIEEKNLCETIWRFKFNSWRYLYWVIFRNKKRLGNFKSVSFIIISLNNSYIDPEFENYKKPVVNSLNESLHILKTLNYENVNVSELIEATVQMVDICRRYNILPDLDNYTLGEQKEIEESLDESVVNDLSKVLIPSSNNVTTGNTLQKFLGQTESKSTDDKLNLMDDHISKVGASTTIYFPSGNTAKVVENKIPNNYKNLYRNGLETYESLLQQWNLPIYKVTNKIKPYFIHNQKRQRISGFDQGDLSPHVPIMLASGRYERMFEQKQRLSNKSYAISLLIDGSGSMIEKNKDELHPWSLASALIGASYLSQICFWTWYRFWSFYI